MQPQQPKSLMEQLGFTPEQVGPDMFTQTPFSGLTAASGMDNNMNYGMDTSSPYGSLQQGTQGLQGMESAGQPQEEQKGNLFTRSLPFLGGLALPMATAPISAALAPVTGGLSLLGQAALTAGLSGAGQAGGKALQNVLEGREADQNLGQEFTQGGLAGLTGFGAGKVLSKAGGKLVGYGERAAAKQAAKEATQAAEEAALKAGKQALTNEQMVKSNYQVWNPKSKMNLEFGSALKNTERFGFDKRNPYDMQKVAKAALDEIGKVYDAAVQASPALNLNDTVRGYLAAARGGGSLTASEVTNSLLDAGLTKNIASLASVPGTSVRAFQQALGRRINNYQVLINNALQNGLNPTEYEAALKELSTLYGNVGKLLDNKAVNKAVQKAMTEGETRGVLQQQYGKQLGDFIADTIDNAKTGPELRKAMQPFTKMDTISQQAIKDIEQAPGTAADIQRLKLGKPSSEGIGQPVIPESLPTEEGPASAADLAMKVLEQAPSKSGMLNATIRAAQEAGVVPAVSKGVGRALEATGKYAAPTTVGLSGISSMGPGGPAPMNQQPTANAGMAPGGLSNNPFLSFTGQAPGYLMPIAQQAMIGMFAPQLMSSAPSAQAAEAAKTMQGVQTASSQLGPLMEQFYNAGGAQGGFLGRARGLADMLTGGPAAAYGRQAQQLGGQISNLTGAPVTLPSISQTPTAAQGTLDQLLAALQSYGVNPQVAPIAR